MSYDRGEWAVTREQALEEDAARVGEGENLVMGQPRGDIAEVEQELEECDAIVEATYTMPVQVHASMETHGAVVEYRGGDEATVYSSSQYINAVPGSASRPLELQASQVVGIVEHMGGGFGAKLSFGVAGLVACRLAKEAGAPIHLMLTREQEFVCTGNRSGSYQWMRGGANKDGSFVALDTLIRNLGGLGRGSHPGQPYLYAPKAFYTAPGFVRTHTNASCPMRAPGRPQASFAIESIVDELSHAVGFDPLEFRKKNLPDEVYHRQLDRVAREIGWSEHPNRTGPPPPDELPEKAIGIGFGVGAWDVPGQPDCQARVQIEPDGSVTAISGSQDIGTGTRTFLAGIVAEELGLPIEAVQQKLGDTRYGPAGLSGGSLTVPSLSPAVKDAAVKAKLALFERVAPLLETTPDNLRAAGEAVYLADDPSRRLAWKAVCATLTTGLSEVGEFRAELAGSGVHGAQAARVEVDTLTGEVRVLKMVAVQDCGIPLNRLTTRSQIQGAMIGSLSYGLLEERLIDADLGLQLNPGFVDYKIAGISDMPEFVAIIDDEDTRQKVTGIGEPPVVPGQSAIANAVFNACGARVRDLPITPDKVIERIAALREE